MKNDFLDYCLNYYGYYWGKLGYIDNDIDCYNPLHQKIELFYAQ